MYNWNPVFNLVMQVKNDYIELTNDYNNYNFTHFLEVLNNKYYNEVFSCLEIGQRDEFIILRYGLDDMAEGMWSDPNSLYRECRSLVLDLKREAIVISPFRKFFNLNEVEENKLSSIRSKLDNASNIEVTDKMDGSMQSARFYNGEIFISGSRSITLKESWRLQDGFSKLNNNHIRMMKENANLTFIFEYISKKDAHVVHYEESSEGMYLIGVRDSTNGSQWFYRDVIDIANKYKIDVVNRENKTLDELLREAKVYKSNEKEGWVLNIDGHMIKIKCDDYVNIHRILDRVSSINVIIKAIADGTYDDLISKVPDLYKERVEAISNLIFNYIKESKRKIKHYYNQSPKSSKKDFMLWVDENVPNNLKVYVRCEYLDREYNLLTKGGGTGYKKLKELNIQEDYSAIFYNKEDN